MAGKNNLINAVCEQGIDGGLDDCSQCFRHCCKFSIVRGITRQAGSTEHLNITG